jgi:hypothetical protein
MKNRYLTLIIVYICDDTSLSSSYDQKCFNRFVGKIKTHYFINNLFQNTLPFIR